jgi:hypothetical protein
VKVPLIRQPFGRSWWGTEPGCPFRDPQPWSQEELDELAAELVDELCVFQLRLEQRGYDQDQALG